MYTEKRSGNELAKFIEIPSLCNDAQYPACLLIPQLALASTRDCSVRMTHGSRGVGALSRNLQSRWSAPAIHITRSSRRCMAIAADSNPLARHDGLPDSMKM